MLSVCDTVEDIAFWARAKEAWLRRFLVLKNGIPSEETFLRIFRLLDPKTFETAFRRWVRGVVGALSGTLAIDGKTIRGTATRGESAIHMVSTFATELGVVLGRKRLPARATKSPPFPNCSTRSISRACSSTSTPWAARSALPRRLPPRAATTC